MFSIKNNYLHIQQRILLAEQHANRVGQVRLLAVSKRHSMDKIVWLHQLGQLDFGESYLQEALDKIEQLQQYPIIWHFIGPIQSNKTRHIAQLFDWVHSVDRLKIMQRLNDQRDKSKTALNICLQVNINNESSKSGFSLSEVNSAVEQVIKMPQLKLRGLMAIPIKSTYIDQQKQNFSLLSEKLKQLNQQFSLNMDTLSMGMSNDLEAAISEGATIIRVGRALFGERDK